VERRTWARGVFTDLVLKGGGGGVWGWGGWVGGGGVGKGMQKGGGGGGALEKKLVADEREAKGITWVGHLLSRLLEKYTRKT